MTSRRAVRPIGSVMAILRARAAIISITNWYAAWPKTTVPLWAPIFGDNKHRVVLKRWQSVGVLALLILCAGFAALTPAAIAQSTKKASFANSKKSKKRSGVTKRRRRNSPRLRRMHQAFVASATLKPMARQLLQDRNPQAYAGVESFARKHSAEDAGSLAWLATGYAHFLDHDYAKAVDPLSRAKPHAGDIGDYVAYYLAASYLQSGRTPEAVAALSTFDETFPQSLLLRDAHVLYANALLTDNRPKEAVALLEKEREPIRADLELALGRAYAAAADPAKAVTVLRHLYFSLPLSFETTVAQSELQKLASTPGISPPAFGDRKSRADLLARAKRFPEAADAYRELLREAIPADNSGIQL